MVLPSRKGHRIPAAVAAGRIGRTPATAVSAASARRAAAVSDEQRSERYQLTIPTPSGPVVFVECEMPMCDSDYRYLVTVLEAMRPGLTQTPVSGSDEEGSGDGE